MQQPKLLARFSTVPCALRCVLAALVLAACESPVQRAADVPVDLPLPPETSVSVTGFLHPAPPPGPTPKLPGQVTLINSDSRGEAVVRLDVNGNSLDAHDGEIEYFGGMYYLYGVSYGCGFHWRIEGSPFCGIRVYSSPDLVEWTDRGLLFNPMTRDWQIRCNGATMGCFRPHVAYSAKTRKYVLWVNTYDVPVGYRVFEADAPAGPFIERRLPRLVTGRAKFDPSQNQFNGDHNLFVDDDGEGYLVYTDWRSGGDIIVEQLTQDLSSGTGKYVRLGTRYSEAPSMFKREGRYYITFSDPACPYCGTGTSYLTAARPLGPWSGRGRVTDTSCGGQPTHVSPLPTVGGEGVVYLYQSDLWQNNERNQAASPQFWGALRFGSTGEIEPLECRPYFHLPLVVSGGSPAQETMGSHVRLSCDVGAWDGHIRRELRFTPDQPGRLRRIALPVYKKGSPSAPLRVEILSDTQVLQTLSIPADQIAWNVRRRLLETDVALVAGRSYSIRLSAANAGPECYGFAYYADEQPRRDFQLYASRWSLPWSRESALTLQLQLQVVSDS